MGTPFGQYAGLLAILTLLKTLQHFGCDRPGDQKGRSYRPWRRCLHVHRLGLGGVFAFPDDRGHLSLPTHRDADAVRSVSNPGRFNRLKFIDRMHSPQPISSVQITEYAHMSNINFITRIGQVLLAVAATGVSVLVLQFAMLA
jgi:hypothetical protein